MNIPVMNEKDLSLAMNKICSQCFSELLEKEIKMEGKKETENIYC
jgi:superfamily II helicase